MNTGNFESNFLFPADNNCVDITDYLLNELCVSPKRERENMRGKKTDVYVKVRDCVFLLE